MGLLVAQISIDDSSDKTITGVIVYDRAGGGVLVPPSGSAFPVDPAPVAGEYFWRTDEVKLYRRNTSNTAWEAVTAVPTAHKTTHEPGGSDALTVDAAAATGSLRTVGTGALQACAGNDSRLSDARAPTAHKTTHEPGGSDAMAVDAAASTGSLRTLGTGALQACAGNDSRLSNARTPTAHASTHQNGGGDEVATATAAANAIPKAGAGAKLDVGWLPTGSTGTTVCIGNDSRLSDARTPTAHATSHKSGGSDAVKLDELAAPTDITTLNASISAHGLLPKLSGSAAQFLDGTGAWSAASATDTNAIHKNVAAEISTITEKTAPVAADLLIIEDSAASNAKKRVQVTNLLPQYGRDFQQAASEGTSTTTSATFQDKTTLTTGALTGVYRVAFSCEIRTGNANTRHQCRLYNSTDAAELCFDDKRPSLSNMDTLVSGFCYVTFAGAAKTFILQFASQNGSATVTIRRARIELWKVST